jgi:hypothetical protein
VSLGAFFGGEGCVGEGFVDDSPLRGSVGFVVGGLFDGGLFGGTSFDGLVGVVGLPVVEPPLVLLAG